MHNKTDEVTNTITSMTTTTHTLRQCQQVRQAKTKNQSPRFFCFRSTTTTTSQSRETQSEVQDFFLFLPGVTRRPPTITTSIMHYF
jgi:hypothetical protein